jgi:single-stranded-DNA-specific exonuclease
LLSTDEAEAARLAAELDRANAERQELQARIAAEAIEQAASLGSAEERRSLVVSSSSWHAGVVGIVASRLVEKFHRPALVLAEDGGVARGSGRSVEGFHLYDALAACAEHVTKFGGHKHAAGLTLAAGGIARFAEAFEERARAGLSADQLVPRLRIDARLGADEATLRLADQLRRLAPFGAGNPEPVFLCEGVPVEEVRLLPDKRGTGPGHVKLRLLAGEGAVDAIGFGLGDRAPAAGSSLSAAVQLGIDSWSGADRVQLKVKGIR